MTILRLTLSVLLVLSLAACGGAAPSTPPGSVDPGPAIDTDTLVADDDRPAFGKQLAASAEHVN